MLRNYTKNGFIMNNMEKEIKISAKINIEIKEMDLDMYYDLIRYLNELSINEGCMNYKTTNTNTFYKQL